MRLFRKKPAPETAEVMRRRKVAQRQIAIRDIVQPHLDNAKLGGPGFKVKEQVLVPYEDLMRIWSLAHDAWLDSVP
ncbi:hypothetical protein Pan1_05 [Pseudanabaena phage Pan1]|nr:hypothetical protein Pan1_05 [Pseudanabaena phage Pan1]